MTALHSDAVTGSLIACCIGDRNGQLSFAAKLAATCSGDLSSWRHPKRRVKSDRLAIQHRVLDYLLRQLRVLRRVP
jgi:hypothetical protein